MKNLLILFLSLVLVFVFGESANAVSLASKLSGKILLNVEANGEAWYVYPEDNKRYFLGRPSDAFALMRELGLGINEIDFQKLVKENMPEDIAGDTLLSEKLSSVQF